MTDIVDRLIYGTQLRNYDSLVELCKEAADTIEDLRSAALAVDEINGRLHKALQNIAIGGNGERNWTLDEVRAVAWDALEPKP